VASPRLPLEFELKNSVFTAFSNGGAMRSTSGFHPLKSITMDYRPPITD